MGNDGFPNNCGNITKCSVMHSSRKQKRRALSGGLLLPLSIYTIFSPGHDRLTQTPKS